MRKTERHSSFKDSWLRWVVLLAIIGFTVVVFLPSLRRMSFNIWLGAIAAGLVFSLVALGVYISFRVLDFPDLTIDGSFPLGAALAATFITSGMNPYLTLPVAFIGGALAGTATALIATRLEDPQPAGLDSCHDRPHQRQSAHHGKIQHPAAQCRYYFHTLRR